MSAIKKRRRGKERQAICRKNLYTRGIRQIADNVNVKEVQVNKFHLFPHTSMLKMKTFFRSLIAENSFILIDKYYE